MPDPMMNQSAFGLMPNASYLYGRDTGGPYDANRVAGIPGITQQGWGQGLQSFGQQMPVAQQFGALAGQGAESLAGMYGTGGFNQGAVPGILGVGSSMDFFDNPTLDASIAAAQQGTVDQFQRATMPGMNRGLSAAGPGAYNSDRAGIAEGLAQSDLQKNLASTEASMRGQAYGQGLQSYLADRGQTLGAAQQSAQNMMGMGGALGNLYNVASAPSNVQQQLGSYLQGIGGQQQSQMQSQLDAGQNLYSQTYQEPWQQYQQYAGSASPLLSGLYGENRSTTLPEPYQQYSPGMSAIGAGLQGLSKVPWGKVFGGGGATGGAAGATGGGATGGFGF